ncbi:serotonin receptor-like [Tropilaelaps mercedesae]|uniref:Serotonin receptor-like n=1 Tax=Tropilaelaps mercedesae TaxID=418985 RepID=A0A1V9XF00_9ACAR|nr:serotonin receptor-like [Tropilaelaps mercedesae]
MTPPDDTPNGLTETQIQISVSSSPPAPLGCSVVRTDSEMPLSPMSPLPTANKSAANVTLVGSDTIAPSTNSHSGGHSIGRLLVLTRREKSKRDPRGKGATEESIESRRERKARKTVAIITGTTLGEGGVFVACWLPFFSTALLMAVCEPCAPHDLVFSLFLWLGYVNSMLNPIIYTIFRPYCSKRESDSLPVETKPAVRTSDELNNEPAITVHER